MSDAMAGALTAFVMIPLGTVLVLLIYRGLMRSNDE
jgi:hypothetical protein